MKRATVRPNIVQTSQLQGDPWQSVPFCTPNVSRNITFWNQNIFNSLFH